MSDQGNPSDINRYNIAGKLGGVGRSILVDVVHEMGDGHDIQEFVRACRWTQEVMCDKLFGWSVGRSMSNAYSLCSVPAELTDLVCFMVIIFQHLKSFGHPFYCRVNLCITT